MAADVPPQVANRGYEADESQRAPARRSLGRRGGAPVRANKYLKTQVFRLCTMGGTDWGSVSQGKRIQVSWLTSVMKVSTRGRPAGLA